ncbi:hypothetical protein M9Y10_001099 [Tritrichomonas musculus]
MKSILFWKAPESPSRAPEMIGPYFIHLITFIVFKAFLDNAAIQRSFLVYIIFLALYTLGFKALARFRMAYLSFAQIFSIMSYSQLYFIPFGFISRFISSGWGIFFILLPALIVQPLCAYKLCCLIVPNDSEIVYGASHFSYGLFLCIWAILSPLRHK